MRGPRLYHWTLGRFVQDGQAPLLSPKVISCRRKSHAPSALARAQEGKPPQRSVLGRERARSAREETRIEAASRRTPAAASVGVWPSGARVREARARSAMAATIEAAAIGPTIASSQKNNAANSPTTAMRKNTPATQAKRRRNSDAPNRCLRLLLGQRDNLVSHRPYPRVRSASRSPAENAMPTAASGFLRMAALKCSVACDNSSLLARSSRPSR